MGQRAVVRTFKPGTGKTTVTIEAWPNCYIPLEATPEGKTYRLVMEGGSIQVQK